MGVENQEKESEVRAVVPESEKITFHQGYMVAADGLIAGLKGEFGSTPAFNEQTAMEIFARWKQKFPSSRVRIFAIPSRYVQTEKGVWDNEEKGYTQFGQYVSDRPDRSPFGQVRAEMQRRNTTPRLSA